MRVLLLFCHPLEDSYQAALFRTARTALVDAGHEVDALDLYREGFDPVLSPAERRRYHEVPANRAEVEGEVERLLAAEALVLCFPTWCFGPPALLKGFFDRVFLPGVSFHLGADGGVARGLDHIKKLGAIVTYGRSRPVAWLAGDPSRKLVTRYLRLVAGWRTPVVYLAQYDMNRADQAVRARFLDKVGQTMRRF
jgi:putative NADPH-quinone reductase